MRFRFAVLILAALGLASQVLPTLAENLAEITTLNDESQTATIGNVTESMESATVSEMQAIDSTKAVELVSDSETVNEEPVPIPPPPPRLVPSQLMNIRFPTNLRVDPRAKSVFLPRVTINSDNTVLFCVSSPNLFFDIGGYGAVEDFNTKDFIVDGDLSNNLRISGPAPFVEATINANMGLKIYSSTLTTPNSSAMVRLAKLDKVSASESLCADSDVSNLRTIRIDILGLSQTITKAEIGIGKKK